MICEVISTARLLCGKPSSRLRVQRNNFRPGLELVQIIRPLLHHLPAFGEVLGAMRKVVLAPAQVVCLLRLALRCSALFLRRQPSFPSAPGGLPESMVKTVSPAPTLC